MYVLYVVTALSLEGGAAVREKGGGYVHNRAGRGI